MMAPAYGLAEADYFENPNFDDVEPEVYTSQKAFAGSKMALMCFTHSLAKQLEGNI